uniref:Uncharacterized protein n=1 Tax=Rhizophora mucronata TaxID=61149 RepID=A0A2P2L9V1_RHIMU
MVTVLKNVTNVITAVGEMYLFNKHHDNRVWAALFLMVCEVIAMTILEFELFEQYDMGILDNVSTLCELMLALFAALNSISVLHPFFFPIY